MTGISNRFHLNATGLAQSNHQELDAVSARCLQAALKIGASTERYFELCALEDIGASLARVGLPDLATNFVRLLDPRDPKNRSERVAFLKSQSYQSKAVVLGAMAASALAAHDRTRGAAFLRRARCAISHLKPSADRQGSHVSCQEQAMKEVGDELNALGLTTEAGNFGEKAIESIRTTYLTPEKRQNIFALLLPCLAAYDPARALKVITTIDDGPLPVKSPHIYGRILEAALKINDTQTAKGALQDFLKLAWAITELDDRSEVFHSHAWTLFAADEYFALSRAAEEARNPAGSLIIDELFEAAAAAHIHYGHPEKASAMRAKVYKRNYVAMDMDARIGLALIAHGDTLLGLDYLRGALRQFDVDRKKSGKSPQEDGNDIVVTNLLCDDRLLKVFFSEAVELAKRHCLVEFQRGRGLVNLAEWAITHGKPDEARQAVEGASPLTLQSLLSRPCASRISLAYANLEYAAAAAGAGLVERAALVLRDTLAAVEPVLDQFLAGTLPLSRGDDKDAQRMMVEHFYADALVPAAARIRSPALIDEILKSVDKFKVATQADDYPRLMLALGKAAAYLQAPQGKGELALKSVNTSPGWTL